MALQDTIYRCTNESLEAILSALNIRGDDHIVSVCGCGAQPLAILEYVGGYGKVLAIDRNIKQIEFAKELANLMEKEDAEELGKLALTKKEPGYFSDRRRLAEISRNLRNLSFEVADVTKEPKLEGKFLRGYFSNTAVNLILWHPVFERDATIYVVNWKPPYSEAVVGISQDLSKLYAVDEERTNRAKEVEYAKHLLYGSPPWNPIVLRTK